MKYISIILFAIFMVSCQENAKVETLTADEIINKSIEISGGEKFEASVIRFNFRDKYYVARRNKGNFSLIRMFKVEEDSVFDLLSNNGFERFVNNDRAALSDSLKTVYSASVNSVHYFSVLPFGLSDAAVNKELIGEEQIKNKDYFKIKVTFNENGGGEDFEDVFIYWVNKESFKPDYLAYSYNEEDGMGMRFRSAYNERTINDLRIVDYSNYKPKDESINLENLGKAFDNDQLILLSKIELENVEVELIDL